MKKGEKRGEGMCKERKKREEHKDDALIAGIQLGAAVTMDNTQVLNSASVGTDVRGSKQWL